MGNTCELGMYHVLSTTFPFSKARLGKYYTTYLISLYHITEGYTLSKEDMANGRKIDIKNDIVNDTKNEVAYAIEQGLSRSSVVIHNITKCWTCGKYHSRIWSQEFKS